MANDKAKDKEAAREAEKAAKRAAEEARKELNKPVEPAGSPTPSPQAPEEGEQKETPKPKAKDKRELISLHPSEMKAWISRNGKKHKVVYHLKKGVGLISLPNLGYSIKLDDWLSGKEDLRGLPEA